MNKTLKTHSNKASLNHLSRVQKCVLTFIVGKRKALELLAKSNSSLQHVTLTRKWLSFLLLSRGLHMLQCHVLANQCQNKFLSAPAYVSVFSAKTTFRGLDYSRYFLIRQTRLNVDATVK